MADQQKALETQIANIQERTGKSIHELKALVSASGLSKHSDIVSMLKTDFNMGHGDANTVAHLAKRDADAKSTESTNPLDGLYVEKKADLRPIHEALLEQLNQLGDYETAPKQKYVSYRRKKQFAMIGPATNSRVELGLNVKDLPAAPRLEPQGSGKMCHYIVKLTDAAQVDDEVKAWLRAAYTAAG
ncbi:MAG: DUF5655 domain-containing protein [Pseudidiomarina maritima]|nr:DUF5655 domain-containing protein [Pseudidiomarina maritima]